MNATTNDALIECSLINYSPRRKSSDKHLKSLIFALRLFKSGAVGYQRIYTKPALGEALGRSSTGSIFSREPSGKNYFIAKNEPPKFRLFYSNFCKALENIKSQKFLQIAVDRFNSALEEWKQEERIIDLAIALEAMFSTSSEDLAYKLRVRVSAFLATSDDEAEFLFGFIKEANTMRSKLVHGKVDSTSLGAFTIQGRRYEYLDTAQELERITRLSLIKFLNFLSDKNYKSDVICNFKQT